MPNSTHFVNNLVAAIPALERPGIGNRDAVSGARGSVSRVVLAIVRVVKVASAAAAGVAVCNVCVVAKVVVVAVVRAVVDVGGPGHADLALVGATDVAVVVDLHLGGRSDGCGEGREERDGG
jgi:hypothetical protein